MILLWFICSIAAILGLILILKKDGHMDGFDPWFIPIGILLLIVGPIGLLAISLVALVDIWSD